MTLAALAARLLAIGMIEPGRSRKPTAARARSRVKALLLAAGLASALLAVAASPASAQKAQVSVKQGKGNRQVIAYDPFGVLAFNNFVRVLYENPNLIFNDPFGQTAAGPGCNGGPFRIICGLDPELIENLKTYILIRMGRGADVFNGLPANGPKPPPKLLRQPWVIGMGFGPDRFVGGPVREHVNGGPGNDKLDGRGGRDLLRGGRGNDRIKGGDGNDRLFGGPGRDRLFGGRGNDRLVGGPGPDRLFGGPGNDVINSRDGHRDIVNCGPGRDLVIADRRDVVRNCERRR